MSGLPGGVCTHNKAVPFHGKTVRFHSAPLCRFDVKATKRHSLKRYIGPRALKTLR